MGLSPEIESDEPVTPAGRLFIQPEVTQVIHAILGGVWPLDVDFIREEVKSSQMIRHPRFSSLLVTTRNGTEYWRKTEVDFDRHLIVVGEHDPKVQHSPAESEAALNDYVADLAVSSPLSTDKPLWEMHLMMAHNSLVFRVHHALGDGISLMSMMLSNFRQADNPEARPTMMSATGRKKSRRRGWPLLEYVMVVWYTFVFVIEFLGRCLWVCDRKTPISGGSGVELWPRKLVTARFLLEDMKVVKRAVPAATINDVLFGIVSFGLAKYLEHRSSKAQVKEGLQLTGMAMVNLREQSFLDYSKMKINNIKAGWGNKFGAILLPVEYHKSSNPLEYLKRAKAMVDKKKHSLEAYFSYKIGDLIMSFFGPKCASLLNYRVVCNTSFSISNVAGPQEHVTLAGKPVTYMRVTTSSLPHAIIMHMLSYAGKADMQLLVAKDIIPDPEILAKCFEDALHEMKQAAVATTKMI